MDLNIGTFVDLYGTYTEAPGIVGVERWFMDKASGLYVRARLVRNPTGSGVTLAQYSVGRYASGSLLDVGLAAADSPGVHVAGALASSLAAGYYGWAVCWGDFYGIADENITADALLVVKAASAAGRLNDAAVAGIEHCIVGRAKAAVTGGAGTTFGVFYKL